MEKNKDKGMTRRSALKRMGLLVAGAALGVPSLSSCDGDKRKRIILYFTATGNSLYVARQLADEVSRKAGNAFDYITSILMVNNWLPNFDMNEQIKIDKHIPESMKRITADIVARKHEIPPTGERAKQLFDRFIRDRGLDPEVGYLMHSEDYFVVTDACIGCAVCTEVCPRGNYELTSTGVKTKGDCDFCFACIQNCPQKAIKFAELPDSPFLSHGEKNPNARFRNEHVSLWSIKEANRQ